SGVRVNTVSPGPVATALWLGGDGVAATVSRATGIKAEEVVDHAAHQSVTGRFTQPSEVADLVVLLSSDRTANVTGADIRIGGGPAAVRGSPPALPPGGSGGAEPFHCAGRLAYSGRNDGRPAAGALPHRTWSYEPARGPRHRIAHRPAGRRRAVARFADTGDP